MFHPETPAGELAIVGLCAILLGVGMRVLGRPTMSRRANVVAALVLVVLALAAVICGAFASSVPLALAFAALGGLWSAGWAFRSGWVARVVVPRLSGRPFQVSFLVCGGLSAVLGSVLTRGNPSPAAAREESTGMRQVQIVPSTEAITDRGTRLPLFEPSLRDQRQPPTEESSTHLMDHAAAFQVLRTAPGNPVCNCHGWIFTGGTFWVRGIDVPIILNDNGYSTVANPAPNDLIVYYNDRGAAVHLGLVRAVLPDGLVLVESKWGGLGRYLHAPDGQAYAQQWSYYRSTRRGHRLRGDYWKYTTDDPNGGTGTSWVVPGPGA